MYSFLVNKIQRCLLYSSTLYSLLTGSDRSFNQAWHSITRDSRCLVGLIYAGWLCWLFQNVVVDLKRCPHISRSVKLQNLQNKIPHTTLGQCLVSGFYSKFLMWHSTILSFLLICWPLKYSVREVLMAKNWALRQILALNLTRPFNHFRCMDCIVYGFRIVVSLIHQKDWVSAFASVVLIRYTTTVLWSV